MNVIATITPSGVYATFTPMRSSHCPIQPLAAYTLVSAMPDTAVGRANGRSIIASTIRLPGKR